MSDHILRTQTTLVNDVRVKIFQALPRASDNESLLRNRVDDVQSIALDQLLELAASYRGGFDQQITAQVLAHVYRRLGYESAALQIGDRDSGFIHTLTLVVLKSGQQSIVSIQDAYYNFTIENHDGLASDYYEVVCALQNKNYTAHQLTLTKESKQVVEFDLDGNPIVHCGDWYWADPSWMKWLEVKTGSNLLINCLLFPIELIEIEEESPSIKEALAKVSLQNSVMAEFDKLLGVNSNFRKLRLEAAEMAVANSSDFQKLRFMRIAKVSYELQESLSAELAGFPKEKISHALRDDPWLRNYFLNWWEYSRGETTLETVPWNVTLPIADICNARCSFCTSWLEGKELISLEQIDAFEPIIRMAHQLGLAGHGEPLVHPKLKELLQRLVRFLDPRATAYLITNGIYLEENITDLLDARVRVFNISLNAASAEVHDQVMGLGPKGFDRVIAGIRALLQVLQGELDYQIYITLVVTAQNVHQLADFIRLGIDLGVTGVMLRSLAGQTGFSLGLNYHTLPPYLHPQFETHVNHALDAIEQYKGIIDIKADTSAWRVPIFPQGLEQSLLTDPPPQITRSEVLNSKAVRNFYRNQTKFGAITKGLMDSQPIELADDDADPFNRQARFNCRAPYQFLYINDFSFNMVPCCYMSNVPAHQNVIYNGSYNFMEAWNSPAMVQLRSRLKNGPLYSMCKRCPAVY